MIIEPKLPREEMEKARDLLLSDGYFMEAQAIGNTGLQAHPDRLKDELRKCGYEGRLMEGAIYHPKTGNVYYMYNPEIVSYHQAREITRRWIGS